MRAYIDTNIFCRLLEDDRNKIDDDQLESLEKLVDRDDIELVTSKKLLEEVSATKDDRRKKKLRILFKIISKIEPAPYKQFISGYLGGAPLGAVPLGGGINFTDEKFQKIKSFFDQNDSEHIFTANKRGCGFFLTLDYKSILKIYKKNYKEINVEISPMKIVDPTALDELLEITRNY